MRNSRKKNSRQKYEMKKRQADRRSLHGYITVERGAVATVAVRLTTITTTTTRCRSHWL